MEWSQVISKMPSPWNQWLSNTHCFYVEASHAVLVEVPDDLRPLLGLEAHVMLMTQARSIYPDARQLCLIGTFLASMLDQTNWSVTRAQTSVDTGVA